MITIEAINGVPVRQEGINLPGPDRKAVVAMGGLVFSVLDVLTQRHGKKTALRAMLAAVKTAAEVNDINEVTEEAIAARLDNIDIREVSEDPAQ